MKKKSKFLMTMTLLSFVGVAYGQTNYYVSPNGSDSNNDCTDAVAPCGTISYAIENANNNGIVQLAPGDYALTEVITIDKPLTLRGSDENDKPVIRTDQETFIEVDSKNVTIKGLRLEMGLSESSGKIGIASTSKNFKGLNIKNNEIVSTTNFTFLAPMTFESYGILLTAGESSNYTVVIEDNFIGAAGTSIIDNKVIGRGIALGKAAGFIIGRGAGGTIRNNKIETFYNMQISNTGGDLNITKNELVGMFSIGFPKSGAKIIVDNNDFQAAPTGFSDNFIVQASGPVYSVVDVRKNDSANVEIKNNTISNYTNYGVLSMASKNLKIKNNIFTPADDADNFVSIMLNTKLMTSGTQNTSSLVEAGIYGNKFNAATNKEGKGAAMTFADHYGVNENPFGKVVIGGVEEDDMNWFDPKLANYIIVDDESGSSDNLLLWSSFTSSTMKPVTQDFVALMIHNKYNLSLEDTELKNLDSLDNQALGRVILGEEFNTSGINTLNISDVKVFPNPVSNNLNVSLNSDKVTTAIVIDYSGKVLRTKEFSGATTIDVTDLSSGVYFVKLENSDGISTVKFVRK